MFDFRHMNCLSFTYILTYLLIITVLAYILL